MKKIFTYLIFLCCTQTVFSQCINVVDVDLNLEEDYGNGECNYLYEVSWENIDDVQNSTLYIQDEPISNSGDAEEEFAFLEFDWTCGDPICVVLVVTDPDDNECFRDTSCFNLPDPPLPVVMVGFDGINVGVQNALYWQTFSEENFSHFTIEHSIDNGENWSEIGEVKGLGGNRMNDYSFYHNPNDKENLYQLKLIDLDGEFSYSEIISVYSQIYYAKIIPNPFSKYLESNFEGVLVHIESNKEFKVLEGTNDTKKWPEGMYIFSNKINIHHNGESFKLLKVKKK